MPLIETRGAGSAQGFGEFAQSAAVNYIEDVFSTYLWTGTGSNQTLTTNVDTSTYGGLFWTKNRTNVFDHALWSTDFSISGNYLLKSNTTGALTFGTYGTGDYVSNSTTGVTVYGNSSQNYVTWTFRKQKKFFDVVTYTGNGTTKTISHNLGSVPGCIIVKDTSSTMSWVVYHRSNGNDKVMYLNGTQAVSTDANVWNSYTPTATDFQVGGSAFSNSNGDNYVAYLFAHDAGGFGLSGSDNVISCGSFTTDGSGNATVSLGYEPQWVMTKCSSTVTSGWNIVDSMRGNATLNGTVNTEQTLRAESSNAESSTYGIANPTSTGFVASGWAGSITFIYIAIRRGPMKTPTSGTSVFSPNAFTTNNVKQTTGFPVDMLMGGYREAGSNWAATVSRLQGLNTTTTSGSPYPRLVTSSSGAELSGTNVYYGYDNTGFISGGLTGSADNIAWSFRRAPGFFDVVCYTGTGSATTFSHNLGVAPELVIVKWRSGATGEDWPTMCTAASSSPDKRLLYLDLTAAGGGLNGVFANSSGTPVLPTSTQVYIGTNDAVNKSAATYVAYLFATVAGVSKVGSYTGTGTTLQIDCGFTGGARFILIKRTDSTGDWYVWDTARGIVASTDPYLVLNSTAAEVTTTDWVDTYSAGFELSSAAGNNVNINAASYIFLSIS